jgi:hypothetical protein
LIVGARTIAELILGAIKSAHAMVLDNDTFGVLELLSS